MLGGSGTFEFTDIVSLENARTNWKSIPRCTRVHWGARNVCSTYKPAFINISQLSGYKWKNEHYSNSGKDKILFGAWACNCTRQNLRGA